jgi:hypothetical protein
MAVGDSTSGKAGSTTEKTHAAPILVDLGRRRRKQVRRLRKGTGKLMDEINIAIGEIQRTGKIASDAQPIIVIVREKPKAQKFGFPSGC